MDDLSVQCPRIKCEQSCIHAVTPPPPSPLHLSIHSSLQHTLAGNPHLMTELPGYLLMEAPFSPSLFLNNTAGKYDVNIEFMLVDWHKKRGKQSLWWSYNIHFYIAFAWMLQWLTTFWEIRCKIIIKDIEKNRSTTSQLCLKTRRASFIAQQ